MKLGWNCVWNVKHIRDGKVIWTFEDRNLLVAEGAKALVDTLFRANDAAYFATTDFWVGVYRGGVSKSTRLATIAERLSLSPNLAS